MQAVLVLQGNTEAEMKGPNDYHRLVELVFGERVEPSLFEAGFRTASIFAV